MAKLNKICNQCNDVLTEDNWYPSYKKGGDYKCKYCARKNSIRCRNEKIEQYRRVDREDYKNFPHKYWCSNSIERHKTKGYIVTFNRRELLDIVKNIIVCKICGVNLKWERGKGVTNNSPTLDRINNEKIINLQNIQILCKKCNTSKQDRTIEELKEWCKRVLEIY